MTSLIYNIGGIIMMYSESPQNDKDVLFLEGFFFLLKEAFQNNDELVQETTSQGQLRQKRVLPIQ